MASSTAGKYSPKPYDLLLEMSDSELHAEYWRGDLQNAPEILLQRHFRKFVGMIVRVFYILQNDAEEIVDDAFLETLGQRSLEGERGFQNFMNTVARHRALDRVKTLRRQLKRVTSLDEDRTAQVPASGKSPEMLVTEHGLRQTLEKCRSTLTDREREVLYWRFLDFTLKDVGERLGCTHENCRQAQVRAINKLQNCLKAHGVKIGA